MVVLCCKPKPFYDPLTNELCFGMVALRVHIMMTPSHLTDQQIQCIGQARESQCSLPAPNRTFPYKCHRETQVANAEGVGKPCAHHNAMPLSHKMHTSERVGMQVGKGFKGIGSHAPGRKAFGPHSPRFKPPDVHLRACRTVPGATLWHA